jgi:hypothetical protein
MARAWIRKTLLLTFTALTTTPGLCAVKKAHQKPFPLPEKFLKECDSHDDHRNYAENPKHQLNPDNIRAYIKVSKNAEDFFRRIDRDSHLLGRSVESNVYGNYALMWKSQSLQKEATSKEYPRMIFLRDGAIIAATHSPNPEHKLINERPEMIWFDPKIEASRFFIIDLASKKKKLIEIPRNDPQKQCNRCHGVDMRPIWTSYRTWPGAYLSAEGEFIDVYKPKTGLHSLLGRTWYGENAAGMNGYLNLFNFKRVARILRQSPAYPQLKYALMAAVLECPDLPSFLGEAKSKMRLQHEKKSGETFEDSEKIVSDAVDDFYESLQEYATQIGDREALRQGNRERNDVKRISGIRYLFEGNAVKTGYLSLSRRRGSKSEGYGFHRLGGDSNGLRGLTCELLPSMVQEDPRLAPLLDLDASVGPNTEQDQNHCGLLKDLSLKAQATAVF